MIPQVRRVMIPDNSADSETKYEIKAIINIRSVSVIAEWTSILNHLKSKLLNIPNTRPIATDDKASARKFPRICGTVFGPNSTFYNPCTVLNKIILTMSLNTPSPYTMENNFG